MDSGDDRYSTAGVGLDWTLIPGPTSALIDRTRHPRSSRGARPQLVLRSFRGGRNMKFADRDDAGRRLADKLAHLKNPQPVVLALPRGDVAVGFEIARALFALLDIVLGGRFGVTRQPELALGAVTDGASPETSIDRQLAASLDIPDSFIKEETARQLEEIERRRRSYCEGRPALEVAGRTAIVVDDGIATGATMRVAWQAVRRRGPARLVSPCPWRRRIRSQPWARGPTKPSAWRRRSGSGRSASRSAGRRRLIASSAPRSPRSCRSR